MSNYLRSLSRFRQRIVRTAPSARDLLVEAIVRSAIFLLLRRQVNVFALTCSVMIMVVPALVVALLVVVFVWHLAVFSIRILLPRSWKL